MRGRSQVSAIAFVAAIASSALYATGHEEAAVLTGTTGITGAGAATLKTWLKRLEARLTDCSAERRRLEDEIAQSQAAHAATVSLRAQLIATAEAEDAAREQRLADEVEAARSEFEEARAADLCEAFESGALWERRRVNGGAAPTDAKLIYLAGRRRHENSAASSTV